MKLARRGFLAGLIALPALSPTGRTDRGVPEFQALSPPNRTLAFADNPNTGVFRVQPYSSVLLVKTSATTWEVKGWTE